MNAAFIVEALRQHQNRTQLPHVFFEEVRLGSGFGAEAEGRIDAWAMQLWPSARFLRTAYEVKTSRSDFLRDGKKVDKQRRALAFSNEFFFATPVGLLKPDELPLEAGLLEVAEDGTCAVVKPPLYREGLPPTWRFLASICRRVAAVPS